MADFFPNSALDVQFQETTRLLELCATSKLSSSWEPFLENEEFLAYAAYFNLSRYVMAALVNRDTCHPIKSAILHAISARVGLAPRYSQDDIDLAEELLRRGADPNYKNCLEYTSVRGKYYQVASPFCDFLARILKINLQRITKLSIQRLCHVMELFLSHGANTSDLVNVNFRVSNSQEVEFLSAKSIANLELVEEAMGTERLRKKSGDKDENSNMFCSLLVPAFILIDVLVYQLEKALYKTSHLREECCSQDHFTSIRAKAKLAGATIEALKLGITVPFLMKTPFI
jgi:hypothetical protein